MLFCITIFALAALTKSYYIPNGDIRIPQCQEVLDTADVVLLKRNCDYIIRNEHKETLLLEFWSEAEHDYSAYCHKLKLIDRSTGSEISLCEKYKFSGVSQEYQLRTTDLVNPVEMSIGYAKRTFSCPGRISQELVDAKFNISHGSESSCPFAIYSKGILHLRLLSAQSDEEVNVEVRQGRHLRRVTMSTGTIPLQMDDTLEVPLYCGIHILIISGPPALIEAEVQEPINRQDESAVKQLLNCPL